MSFTDEEITFLRSQPTARFATVGPGEQPDVVPVALEFDGTFFWVGGVGDQVLETRKFRNVETGFHKVALVVDDMVSFDPFVRGIRVYGRAEGPVERVGMVGRGYFLRVTPTVSWTWNLDGRPVGTSWYETTRTEHAPPSVATAEPAAP